MKEFVRWAFQYLVACGAVFGLLARMDMSKGTAFADAWISALAWAVVSSAIFIGVRYRKAKQGAACAVCETLQSK